MPRRYLHQPAIASGMAVSALALPSLATYDLIADEMKDKELSELVKRIGLVEGMPVVTNPGIIAPEKFADEVINVRIPNPFMPDTPQRIATDTVVLLH